jgi:hypothetical protein
MGVGASVMDSMASARQPSGAATAQTLDADIRDV